MEDRRNERVMKGRKEGGRKKSTEKGIGRDNWRKVEGLERVREIQRDTEYISTARAAHIIL
jgi:hypothetical protein